MLKHNRNGGKQLQCMQRFLYNKRQFSTILKTTLKSITQITILCRPDHFFFLEVFSSCVLLIYLGIWVFWSSFLLQVILISGDVHFGEFSCLNSTSTGKLKVCFQSVFPTESQPFLKNDNCIFPIRENKIMSLLRLLAAIRCRVLRTFFKKASDEKELWLY